jgi:hypothetical protein
MPRRASLVKIVSMRAHHRAFCGALRYPVEGTFLVKNRRSLTPPTGSATSDVHATRRSDARREVSARVILKRKEGLPLDGWALNVSKGGVRVILEEKVALGEQFQIVLTASPASASPHHGRVVWVQEEPDGVVAGIEFCEGPESSPPKRRQNPGPAGE